ncbi:MAG TPA: hypothetical protein DEA55_02395 [Rhodospirillaceae bacterium]|nr:hypothetical protein [Rhodospirillaceae bacterium]
MIWTVRAFLLSAFSLSLMSLGACAHANPKEFRSTQHLYDHCKEDLASNHFEGSYCAAYIEGYLGGGSVSGLYILGQANNQEEILKRAHNRKCADLDRRIANDQKVIWLAKYFIDWIESNQKIVKKLERESGFMNKPAFGALHLLTVDERFCVQPSE